MKKLGLLLCMLLGLAACGQDARKLEEVTYETLEEAIAAAEEEYADIKGEFVKGIEIENQYIAAFVEQHEPEPALRFMIYEKTEDGVFLKQYGTVGYAFYEHGATGVSGEMDWTEQDGTCILYEAKVQGLGYEEPTAEDLQVLDFAGEVLEKDGYYFALHLNTYRGAMPVK